MNAAGRRCVHQVKDELTKNRREEHEAEEGGLMYETTKESTCPVKSFEKYISKLNPGYSALFQRPNDRYSSSIDRWYDNQVAGVNLLGNKMKSLSRMVGLSKEYTNHSIRTTSVTILEKNGFEACHIMSVSGHREESSIRSHARTPDSTKLAMSNAISGQSTHIMPLQPVNLIF